MQLQQLQLRRSSKSSLIIWHLHETHLSLSPFLCLWLWLCLPLPQDTQHPDNKVFDSHAKLAPNELELELEVDCAVLCGI